MIITSGILARDMNLKQVQVKGNPRAVLNNCIFIKGKGEKDIPVSITAWGDWAVYIAQNFKKGDPIHIIGDETPELYTSGESKIDLLGCVVKAVVDAQVVTTANSFFKSMASELSGKQKSAGRSEEKVGSQGEEIENDEEKQI